MKYQAMISLHGFAGMKKSELNAVLKAGFTNQGEYWHRNYRKKHFSNLAYGEYGYQRRTAGYNKRKQKYFGHNLPLVFTGQSRDLSQSKNVRSTKKECVVTMPVRAFNFKRTPSSPDLQKEFRTVSASEQKILDDRMENHIVKSLSRSKSGPTTKDNS